LTAPDERGVDIPPPSLQCPLAAEWLPPPAFLPPGIAARLVALGLIAGHSVSVASRSQLSGLLSTAEGVRRGTILLDTGATHTSSARLVAALGLPLSGQPGPLSVATAAAGGAQGLGAPVLIHLSLSDVFREAMSISYMDMDVGDDLFLGWDCISSHDLHNLFQAGQVGLRSGPNQLRPSRVAPRLDGRFAEGVEVLQDGTELHLASFNVADVELRLAGDDDAAFAALKVEYADVLGGAPPGLPPERGMELAIETGDAPMPRLRPVKRLSEGELAELRTQLVDLLDRGWIQHSTAGHAASVVFARKPDGTWRICYDYRGLNAISRPAVEPLPHIGLTGRGGRTPSPSSISLLATTSCGCGPGTGGRRVSGRSWASSSGTWCPSGCRDHRLY
jgi:hypothetical protein